MSVVVTGCCRSRVSRAARVCVSVLDWRSPGDPSIVPPVDDRWFALPAFAVAAFPSSRRKVGRSIALLEPTWLATVRSQHGPTPAEAIASRRTQARRYGTLR
jgi:hypothetical protein